MPITVTVLKMDGEIMRLNFKKCYKAFIQRGTKLTTCRLGDKSNRFQKGKMLELTIGDRYHPEVIALGVTHKVEVKFWLDVRDSDLVNESPDCRYKGGLYCVMYHINRVLLKSDDLVTFIHWNHLSNCGTWEEYLRKEGFENE